MPRLCREFFQLLAGKAIKFIHLASQAATRMCQVHSASPTPAGRISRELAFDKKCHLTGGVALHRVYKLASASRQNSPCHSHGCIVLSRGSLVAGNMLHRGDRSQHHRLVTRLTDDRGAIYQVARNVAIIIARRPRDRLIINCANRRVDRIKNVFPERV